MSEKSANRDANVTDNVSKRTSTKSSNVIITVPGRTKHSLKHRFRCYMQQRSLEVDNFLMQDLDGFRRLNQPLAARVTNLFLYHSQRPEFLSWIHDKLQRVFGRVRLGAPVVGGQS